MDEQMVYYQQLKLACLVQANLTSRHLIAREIIEVAKLYEAYVKGLK